jgi:Methylamine utilisation protein MauE
MDPVIDLTLRAALGLLFTVAATHKLRDPRRFAATLSEYRLLPGWLAGAASVLLVTAELAVVAALAWSRRLGLAGTAALLVLYAGAMATNLARGRRHIDCGCAGPAARRTISGWLVVRNVVLACAALAGLAPIAPRVLLWIDGFTVVVATAVLAACWTAADRLLALAPGLSRLREAT